MNNQDQDKHVEFYQRSIELIDEAYGTPDEMCFIYVQHAFAPLITHLSCIGDRLACLIPKGSSSKSNREVVKELEVHFPGKVYNDIKREHLRDTDFTLSFLKKVTQGRPFAILEYGAYFAPSAQAIAKDPDLGPRLVGFVEGTENGIRGADDKSTIGYQHVAHDIPKPILSKSKSRIKQIMDQDIGPAIVESCNNILMRSLGRGIDPEHSDVGVIGLGSIGRGTLKHLAKFKVKPMIYDSDIAVLAEHANSRHTIGSQERILASSDILFLNTGSCFLAQQPELLDHIKENAILVLCTSGDIEAGIPQLLDSKHLRLAEQQRHRDIATYLTRQNKAIRVMLGGDSVGQAPNLVIESGSNSLANLMSDMEFYGLGCYLGSKGRSLPTGCISKSPNDVQDIILKHWLQVFHVLDKRDVASPKKSISQKAMAV